jgi:hypothetical protein
LTTEAGFTDNLSATTDGVMIKYANADAATIRLSAWIRCTNGILVRCRTAAYSPSSTAGEWT